MSPRLGRRALLGLSLLDDPPPRPAPPQPAPAAQGAQTQQLPRAPRPDPKGFSLDAFYARRAASGGASTRLPPFAVRAAEAPVETSWRGCPELHPREESPPPWAQAKERRDG